MEEGMDFGIELDESSGFIGYLGDAQEDLQIRGS